jgi:glutamate synthase domain-containing protein 3
MIENHIAYTGSSVGQKLLDRWEQTLTAFVKVMPTDYKLALAEMEKEREEAEPVGEEVGARG